MRNPLDLLSVRESIEIELDLLLLLPVLGLLLLLVRAKRSGKGAGYLDCIVLFWLYLCGLMGYTQFPLSLQFNPEGPHVAGLHLVPAWIEGDPEFHFASRQVWGNFLAGVPFGISYPFVMPPKHWELRYRLTWSAVLAVAPEALQLLQNIFLSGYMIRSVDIDDVWLCFAGTMTGYALLHVCARLYCRVGFARGATLPVWDHFHAVLVHVGSTSRVPQRRHPSPPRPARHLDGA